MSARLITTYVKFLVSKCINYFNLSALCEFGEPNTNLIRISNVA